MCISTKQVEVSPLLIPHAHELSCFEQLLRTLGDFLDPDEPVTALQADMCLELC